MIYLCLEENTQMLSDEVQVLAWRLENGLEVGEFYLMAFDHRIH